MIYLDYAAATPVSKKALSAMLPYFSDVFFNPSAAYLPAKKVRAEYETAKDQIAHCIGAKGTDLVITASATEANNLAFSVLNSQSSGAYVFAENNSSGAHVFAEKSPKCLVLETEHDSVLNVAKNYNCELIKVNNKGIILLDDLKQKINDNVELISASFANNEIGTIQPIAEIAEIIKNEKIRRLKNGIKTPLYFHSDASQALNLIDISVSRLGIDLLTLNSAKVYGPKGVGALYVSHDVKLKPLIYGGGQEMNLRSGTENVASVIGFATAFTEAKTHLSANRKKFEELKKCFIKELEKMLSETTLQLTNNPHENQGEQLTKNAFLISPNKQLSNFIPLVFPGLDAERIIFKLEDKGIYVSTGAACAASKGQKSKTLKAIGLTDQEINGSLRITMGHSTTKEDVVTAARTIAEVALSESKRQH